MAMKIETPLGTLTVHKSNDTSYQGFQIELHRPNELIGMTVALIEVDKTEKEPQLSTRVWGDGLEADYTTKVVHKNIEDFFKEWSEQKMRKTKFRWKTEDGNVSFLEMKVKNGELYFASPNSDGMFFLASNVIENSIAQLVGYDSDGKEVYEGDIVIGAGQEFTVELRAMGVNALDADALEGGLFKFKLKDKK